MSDSFLHMISFFIPLASWIVGFLSTYFVTGLLERRRSFRALVSEIEAIRSEFHDHAKFDLIHARSIESLKPLIFTAIPFLRIQAQQEARKAWASFRDANISQLAKVDIVSRVSGALGDPIITQQKGMDMLLDRLQSYFRIRL